MPVYSVMCALPDSPGWCHIVSTTYPWGNKEKCFSTFFYHCFFQMSLILLSDNKQVMHWHFIFNLIYQWDEYFWKQFDETHTHMGFESLRSPSVIAIPWISFPLTFCYGLLPVLLSSRKQMQHRSWQSASLGASSWSTGSGRSAASQWWPQVLMHHRKGYFCCQGLCEDRMLLRAPQSYHFEPHRK